MGKISKEYEVLDQIFDPAVVLNSNMEIVYFNHIFTVVTKSSPRVLNKKPRLFDLLISKDGILKKLLENAIKDKKDIVSSEMDVELCTDKSFHYTFIVKVICKDNKYLVFFHDLSDEKNLHDKYRIKVKELKESHKQIVLADKLKSLTDLSAGLSHEIATPLSITRGNVELACEYILKNTLSPEKVKDKVIQLLKRSIVNVDTINSIIGNMRAYTAADSEKKEYYDLHKLTREVVEMLKPSKNLDIRVMIDSGNKTYITVINKVEIEQVLINILKNAYDAIKDSNTSPGVINIGFHENKSNHQYVLEIEDNGPGVPEEIRNDIFESFFTTKDIDTGSGLGLAISKRLIEKHQGTLEIGSSLLGGAKFVITLPKSELSSVTMDREYLSNFLDDKKKKILVVDDHVEILNTMSAFLSEMDVMLIGSTRPSDALNILDKFDIDVVITDCQMPDMNGSSFAKKLRKNGYKNKILYMSSKANRSFFDQDSEPLSIWDFLEKPLQLETIREQILKAIV